MESGGDVMTLWVSLCRGMDHSFCSYYYAEASWMVQSSGRRRKTSDGEAGQVGYGGQVGVEEGEVDQVGQASQVGRCEDQVGDAGQVGTRRRGDQVGDAGQVGTRRRGDQVGDAGQVGNRRRGDQVGDAGQVEGQVQVGRSVTVNQPPSLLLVTVVLLPVPSLPYSLPH